MLLLNFSGRFQSLCQGMTGEEERRMIAGLVNTLCQLDGVKRVALFVQGEQPESLAGTVYLPGDFLPNYNLIDEN